MQQALILGAGKIGAVVELVMQNRGCYQGFVRQEDFSLVEVLHNRLGRHYSDAGGKEVSSRTIVAVTTGQQRVSAGASR